MPRERKVYIPKPIGLFIAAILILLWLWITHAAFYTAAGREELGVVGWIVVSIVLLGATMLTLLVAYRKVPAYVMVGK